MKRFRLPACLSSALIASVAFAGAVAAEDIAPSIVPPDLQPFRLGQSLLPQANESRETYLARLLQPLRRYGSNGTELSRDDIERAAAQALAGRRAAFMSAFFSLDRDGDARLNADELAAAPERPQRPMPLPGTFIDADGDGAVSMAEAYEQAKAATQEMAGTVIDSTLNDMLALDPNGDGRLTADELEAVGRANYTRFDADGDGLFSAGEKTVLIEAQRKAASEAAVQRAFGRCNFEKAAASEKLYLIGSHEAGTLSSVTVAGQDRETETAAVEIEPGSEPLYIVASSYTPMIWRVTGAVERVARFHASARGGVGVVGLPKEKLRVVSDGECLPRVYSAGGKEQKLPEALTMAFGKPADGVFFSYTAAAVKLPSQTVGADVRTPISKPRGERPPLSLAWLKPTDAETLNALLRFSPGGVVEIDPASVVASSTAERYAVLPQEAGLLQLLQEGSLIRQGNGVYRIDKPVARFPAGLNGAHSVRFVLGKGIPRPAGSPGHSKVLDADDAQAPGERSDPTVILRRD